MHRLLTIDGVLGLTARGRGGFTDDPFVTQGGAGHQPIPDAADRCDYTAAPIAVDRIRGEDHAGRGRRDHALDDHGHAPVGAGLVLGCTQGLGAGQRPLNRGVQLVRRDIEDRFEHAGKRVLAAILGDPTRPDREGARPQIARSLAEQRPAFLRRHVGDPGAQDHAIGDADARCHEFSEVGGLAADVGDIGHAHVGEPAECCRADCCRVHDPFLEVAKAMTARRTQSTSSAASSTDEPS